MPHLFGIAVFSALKPNREKVGATNCWSQSTHIPKCAGDTGFNQRKLKANTELILGDANLFTLSIDRMPFDVLSCLKKRNSLSFMDNRAWSRPTKGTLQTDFLRHVLQPQASFGSKLVVVSVPQWTGFCIHRSKTYSQTKFSSQLEVHKNT